MSWICNGPPVIGGVQMPHPTYNKQLVFEWTGEDIVKVMESGEVRIVEKRRRGRAWVGWMDLDADKLHALITILQHPPFVLIPAQKVAGDPAWATEVQLLCRCISPIPNHLDYETGGSNCEIEIEAIHAIESVPGLFEGDMFISDGSLEFELYILPEPVE